MLEAFDEDGGGLNVTTTWFTSDGVQVVWQGSALETALDAREPELLSCLLCILNTLKHDESIVEVLEERPI